MPRLLLGEAQEVCVATGLLDVVPGIRTTDFADVEDCYRSELWPRLATGYMRSRRVLAWVSNKRQVAYSIWDIRTVSDE